MARPPSPPPRPRTPLDETLYRDPLFLQHWPLQSQNIMQYFHSSPFFDATSNNGMLIGQLTNNAAMAAQITSQEAFDAKLREMKGEEFVCVGGSEETGVWIVRKQRRWGKGEGDVVRLGTYYVAGTGNVYQAPSVGDVVSNRLLNISSKLRKSLSIASSTLSTAPAVSSSQPAPASSSFNTTTTTTPLPASQQPASTPASTAPGTTAGGSSVPQMKVSQSRAQQDLHLMRSALRMSLQFGGEYMDGPPTIVGGQSEPGRAAVGAAISRPASVAGVATPVGSSQIPPGGQGIPGADVRRSLLAAGAKK
ncbi:hypothetical protein EX30DRAFT_348983 [Ascodesmis nigricans]|uniref:Mediator of RNA polymerase II transcription subunit 6 n=1 Tax=Ascodesmis nigricans TaxID=341454 RepID=A0A4S2MX05_9PEZI|nr:hypothetical protein EX30DRAFT_348983 [Ascodesmis nigricans]